MDASDKDVSLSPKAKEARIFLAIGYFHKFDSKDFYRVCLAVIAPLTDPKTEGIPIFRTDLLQVCYV